VLALVVPAAYDGGMTSPIPSALLAILRAHQAELRARGVESLTLFGSIVRGEANWTSDVDLAVRPGVGFSDGGFDHFGRLDALRDRLSAL
jgi:uncharacterized protein